MKYNRAQESRQQNPRCNKCDVDMKIIVTAFGWKSMWHCPNCFDMQPKVRGDVKNVRRVK